MKKYNIKMTRQKYITLLPVIIALVVMLGRCPSLRAMEMGGDFGISLERAGNLVFNFETAQIQELTGGVQLTLLPEDPNQPPMPISANNIYFTYAGTDNVPSRIVMQGNVRIRHPQGNIQAGRAEWDFEAETLVFTESPKFSSEQVKELTGEEIIVNFGTGKVNVRGGAQGELPVFARGNTPSPAGAGALLREDDVNDWTALIDALKEQAAAEGPSPGKHILGMLDPNMRNAMLNTPTSVLAEQRQQLLRQFNTLLQRNDMYNEPAWSNINVSDTVRSLLSQDQRSVEEQAILNRELLAAAFPELIEAR